ncbi:MAG: MarR family transcriptional regulator [Proteobacteria bacterium]|nr:MarR family transcriptional regulator [Pseudomonadota bacterium]
MTETAIKNAKQRADVTEGSEFAPVTAMLSSRLMVLANLLKRGAILRYRRIAGLSSVEFGLVASLGRHPPISVAQLAALVGNDKGQVSRALAQMAQRGLVSRHANPDDSREVLVALTAKGLAAHDKLLDGARRRTKQLLNGFSRTEIDQCEHIVDRLTQRAEEMLRAEQAMEL